MIVFAVHLMETLFLPPNLTFNSQKKKKWSNFLYSYQLWLVQKGKCLLPNWFKGVKTSDRNVVVRDFLFTALNCSLNFIKRIPLFIIRHGGCSLAFFHSATFLSSAKRKLKIAKPYYEIRTRVISKQFFFSRFSNHINFWLNPRLIHKRKFCFHKWCL